MTQVKKKTAKKTKAQSAPSDGLSSEERAALTGEHLPARQESSPTELMFNSNTELSGATDDVPLRLPRLNIVQRVGPLADEFNKGELVLNGEDVLVDGTETPLEVTAVKAHYFYEEWLQYGDDRIPERAKDANEVYARGGNLDWQDGGKPTWRKVAEVLFCIKAPAGMEESPNFPFKLEADEPDAGSYTFALMKLKGSSMTSAGSELVNASRYYYRKGLSTGSFHMTADLTKFRTGNSAYVCTLKKYQNHSDAFMGWLSEYAP